MKPSNKKLFLLAAAALWLAPAIAQVKPANVLDLKYSIRDSEIVFPESYETDIHKLQERWYLNNYTSADLDATTSYDPGATETQIKERLAALPTIIEMPYNAIVVQYIERYTKTGRKQLTALLGLASYYMPIFEQALEEAGLPLELKYLPVIESGLDPTATSKSGAAGLWQFMIASAQGYDLEVNSLVDERRDPFKSTEKACKLLKDLYDAYGDWSLAIAAYNCGPGTVNKALARAGGDPKTHDFWSIYYYLPTETRGYVPMFIAANYVMNYYPEHNISPVLITKPLITDTLTLTDRVHLNQIAEVLDIPVEELRVLNPQYRADIIPASYEHPYSLTLPSQQVHAFIVSHNQILAYDSDKYARRLEAEPGADPGVLAEELVTPVDPQNPGDPAVVEAVAAELAYEQTHPEEAETPSRRRNDQAAAPAQEAAPKPAAEKKDTTKKKDDSKKKKKADTTPKQTVHTVKSGESLSSIAKKNGVTVDQIRKANPKVKGDMIHPGDKITIPAKTTGKKQKK